jgi:hypothetical protein
VDTSFEPYRRDAFRHRSIAAQRQSIEFTNEPGEGTVNTEGLWRRGMDDWELGAGQTFLDRKGAVANRFYRSKGVDPWIQWQLSLLPKTKQVYSSVSGNGFQVGPYTYVIEAGVLKFSLDLVMWTTVVGVSPVSSDPKSFATNGYDIWVIGTAGALSQIYHTTVGYGAATHFSLGDYQAVFWGSGWLIGASGAELFSFDSTGAATLLIQQPVGWVWSCFGTAASQLYIAGYMESVIGGVSYKTKSAIYRTTAEPTGANLTVPVVALPMEGGEYVTALYGYLNFMFVGTNLGLRMCRTLAAYDPTGAQGDLEAGPLIPNLTQPVTQPVTAIVGNNRWVYFAWTDYDNVSTGLGRADLSTFIDTLAPAYASDRMIEGAGTITHLDWYQNIDCPLISVGGLGIYLDDSVPVDSGYVDSGYITFGIPDDKILMSGDIRTLTPVDGVVTMSIGMDGQNLVPVGEVSDTIPSGVFPVAQIRGENATVRLTLAPDGGTDGPTLLRWTTQAIPAVVSGTTISVVLNMKDTAVELGQDISQFPYAEYAYLEALREAQEVVTYQEGPYSAQVTVDELDWLPYSLQNDNPGFHGTLVVYLKRWIIGSN